MEAPTLPGVAIQDFVAKLRCCSEKEFVDVPHIHQLLRQNPIDPKSIEKYLIWDRQHYTRNLIDKTPLYELLAICWEVGQASSIHTHNHQNCSMPLPTDPPMLTNSRTLQPN